MKEKCASVVAVRRGKGEGWVGPPAARVAIYGRGGCGGCVGFP
jgi:hypothetical protein